MNFKILKRSLKSKKTINFILLVFIMLAAMFIAGSVNNLILITGGLDSYFEKACVDDYVIVGSIGGSRDNPLDAHLMLDEYLSNNEFVDEYTVDDIVFGGSSQIKKEDGTELTLSGTVIISPYNSKQQKFFDQDNREITQQKVEVIINKPMVSLPLTEAVMEVVEQTPQETAGTKA